MDDPTDVADRISRLAEQIAGLETELQELAAGEVDAILDPRSAAPILLREAQAALAKSETRFRSLINRCPAIVCELEPDGSASYVNPAVEKILGYPVRDIQGRHFWELLVPPEHFSAALQLQADLKTGVQGRELPVHHRDGTERWLSWTSAPSEGNRTLLFGLDVSEQRAAAAQARLLEEAERARAEAEFANASKANFLAMMSHELRTPLNAISGYAELIEMGIRGPVTEAMKEDLQKIRRSQHYLLGLINDILSFARIEAGNVSCEPQNVLLSDVFDTVTSMSEPAALEKEIDLGITGDTTIQVWADRERIQQVLVNLVGNALKFTPTGGSIQLGGRLDGDMVEIAVTDSGRGIAKEKLEYIFDPFVQVDRGKVGRNDGIGLGLYISRSLTEEMQGTLTVESVEGQGSTFRLRLPRPELPKEPALS